MIETTTPPVIDPGFAALVRDHVKIEQPSTDLYEDDPSAAYDRLLDHYLEAAIGRVEAMSGRMLFTRGIRLTADGFGAALVLPASPVAAAGVQVKYRDPAGVLKTLPSAAYALVDRLERPRLIPAHGTSWPATRAFPGAVCVTFSAGYGETTDTIPAPLRQAVLQTVADAFRFAGSTVTGVTTQLPESAYRACLAYRLEWC